MESTDTIGIGLLYATVTNSIGFGLLQEGKTMGLAPYGANIDHKIFDFRGEFDGIRTDYSEVCAEGLYEFNGHGLRGPPFDQEPAPGSSRILALGDSFTFGQGIPWEETYTHQLEQILNAAVPTVSGVEGAPRRSGIALRSTWGRRSPEHRRYPALSAPSDP